jgi:hypothetical protein
MKIRIRLKPEHALAAENRKLKSELDFAAASALKLAHEVTELKAELEALRARIPEKQDAAYGSG